MSCQRGVHRAMALNLLAVMRIDRESFAQAVKLLEEALANAEDNREVRVRALMLLSFTQLNAGDFAHAMQNAERAVAHAEDVDDPDLTSQVLSTRAMVACMCGHGIDEASLRRAVALEDPDSDAPIALRASANNALLLALAGRLDEAGERMSAVRRRCIDRGAETDLIFVAVFTALIEIWRGKFTDATTLAEETVERAQQLGGDHLRVVALTVQAAVAAHTGRQSETRETARAAIDLARRYGSPRLADWSTTSLGFLEVSLGNYAEALTILQPLVARFPFVPGTEIIAAGYVPEAVEAMISLGRHSEAEPMIEALETNGEWLDRPWMLAIGARCRSMWLAAHGRHRGAVGMAEEAMAHHERLPMPFERARTLLLLGQLQRRQRKKESARATLTEALEVFEALGTPLWARPRPR